MRNDKANDRRRRRAMAKDASFPQAAEAVKLLLSMGWKWDGKEWCEPRACTRCSRWVYGLDSHFLCPVCEAEYEKENDSSIPVPLIAASEHFCPSCGCSHTWPTDDSLCD